MNEVFLDIKNLNKKFGGKSGFFGFQKPSMQALKNISFGVNEGEVLGVVGESGCGKSTLARVVMGLEKPNSGEIYFEGNLINFNSEQQKKENYKQIQYVFQDSMNALNPRKTIRQSLEAPMVHLLSLDVGDRQKEISQLMEAVNLSESLLDRYPHELSGGQAQRVGIARALAARPKLLVLDEPVSALDVSIQAQVLNLLMDIKNKFGLTYIFISHDLSIIESISDRVMVMYLGEIVEQAPTTALFNDPQHPYTHLLLDSAPSFAKKSTVKSTKGAELPDPYSDIKGCSFADRCPWVFGRCRKERPRLKNTKVMSHRVSCFNVDCAE